MQILRKPPWLKKRMLSNSTTSAVNQTLSGKNLHTVCESAKCPNKHECFGSGTATFMILGEICTRNCGFCGVRKGTPGSAEPLEPVRVAEAVYEMHLKHVVITSVTRDDLPDGGLNHFKETVEAVRKLNPNAVVEILTPDFSGVRNAAESIAEIKPDVFNHNMEMVPRLYPIIRPKALWERSLNLLKNVAK